MILKRVFLVLLCASFLLCTSCGQEEIDTEEILTRLLEVSGETPRGEIYRAGAEEGSSAYLSPSLREAMYGAEGEELFSSLEGYSIYLSSFAVPCEIAVFSTRSASDAQLIAAMCLGRADTLRVLLRQTEFRDMTESIRVVCRGRLVIMGLVEDSEEFEEHALRLARAVR